MARRKFQHGSLTKRGKRKKMWVARFWEDVAGPNGAVKRVRRSETLGSVAELPNRRDAEQILSELLRKMNSGEHRLQSTLTFRRFAEEEWGPQVLPTLKYSTQKNYLYMIKVHLLPILGEMQLRLISREAVQRLLLAKLRTTLSWGTVKRLRTTLGTIMNTAESWGYVPDNVVRKTKLPRHGLVVEKPVIDPQQIRQLLDHLPEPTRTLATLLVLTGLRIGELLALRWRNLDLAAGVVRVRETVYEGHFDEPKTRRSNRVVPLGTKAVALLAARQPKVSDADALVFGTQCDTPFSRRNLLKRQLTPTCKKLGLVGINWHSLRHTNATLLDAVGTPLGTVQALLGHASSEITRGIYIHSLPADARRAVQKVEEILIGPKRTQIEEIRNLGNSVIQ